MSRPKNKYRDQVKEFEKDSQKVFCPSKWETDSPDTRQQQFARKPKYFVECEMPDGKEWHQYIFTKENVLVKLIFKETKEI